MAAERYDVAVIGGGPAGIAAAIGAADCGARTLLVERSDRLGGNAADAWVHTICGLYEPADDGPPRVAHAGFPRRFADALRAADGAGEPERAGRVWVLPTRPPALAALAAELCGRRAPLELRLECELVSAAFAGEGDPAELGLADRRRGEQRAAAQIVVDTSGDASAAERAGAATRAAAPHELQLPSFIFRLEGVDTAELVGFARLRLTHAVASAVRGGELPEGCESVLVRPAGPPGEVYVTLGVPRPADEPYAPLDLAQRARLEADARARARRVADFLRRTRPAFARSHVAGWPRRLGVRESRRVAGRHELSREEVLEGRRHPDEVAVSTWPIELWHDHRRASFAHPRAACSIPLGALVSRSHARLGAAGRCLSASHEALGALRVIGTALATGEAVGVAAALAADAGLALPAVAAGDVRKRVRALDEGRAR